jgi:hypothetical protein
MLKLLLSQSVGERSMHLDEKTQETRFSASSMCFISELRGFNVPNDLTSFHRASVQSPSLVPLSMEG